MNLAEEKKTRINSLITQDYLSVSDEKTVAEVLDLFRENKENFQSKFVYVYVTDSENRLVGVLRIRDLLMEQPERRIKQIMKENIFHVSHTASLDEVLEAFKKSSFFAVPVTDESRHLIGIIPEARIKDHLPSQRLNFYQLSNFTHEEVAGKSVFEIVFKRFPWLLISVTSGLACAYILGLFIGQIESIIALVFFVPIILGIAGNMGTQSAHITTRGLQEGALSITKQFQIFGKEMAIGCLIGGAAFIFAGLIALLFRKSPVEGVALGLSIVAVTFSSGLLGMLLPVAFRITQLKGGLGSGLFILLICDMVALILYFAISLSLISPTLELG